MAVRSVVRGGAGWSAALAGRVSAAWGAVVATRGRATVAAVAAVSLVAGVAWAAVEGPDVVEAMAGQEECAVESARTEDLAFELAVLVRQTCSM